MPMSLSRKRKRTVTAVSSIAAESLFCSRSILISTPDGLRTHLDSERGMTGIISSGNGMRITAAFLMCDQAFSPE